MRSASPAGYAGTTLQPMFIVLPTPEEVAIYCVNDNALFGSEAEWLEDDGAGKLASMRPGSAI